MSEKYFGWTRCGDSAMVLRPYIEFMRRFPNQKRAGRAAPN
jgi:hypothetical protein